MTTEKEDILQSAQKIFLRKGFYKTPLDEIATELKISKKTIYKHFSSKEKLVTESVLNFMLVNHQTVSDLVAKDINAVEKCFKTLQFLSTILVMISDTFLNDIRSFMPDLWNEIDKVRTRILYSTLKSIIEQGQQEGFFIEIESELAITIFIISIRGILNPDVLISNNLSLVKTAKSIVEILLGGVLTDKGRKAFENLQVGETR